MGNLTDRAIRALKPRAKAYSRADGYIPGLSLSVEPTGSKSWHLRFRFKGIQENLGLGRWPGVGLAMVHERAQIALGQVAQGRNPAEDRRHGAAALDMVPAIFESYITRYAKPNLSARWARDVERMLRAVIPVWSSRTLASITPADVHEVLDRALDRGVSVGANRLLAVLKGAGAWACGRGLVAANPFQGIKPPAVEQSRDRVLDDGELRLVWRAAQGLGYPYGVATQFLILTGQRRGEVAGMTWDEFDLTGKVWNLPRERCKNGKAHAVPLSERVIAILQALPRHVGSALVFTADGRPVTGFSGAKRQLGKHLPGNFVPWVLHDLRRSFASGCARLGVDMHVTERNLNHVSGSTGGIAGVYQRHDFMRERRAAMELWGRHVEQIVTGQPVDNIVQMVR
jgi:integrase